MADTLTAAKHLANPMTLADMLGQAPAISRPGQYGGWGGKPGTQSMAAKVAASMEEALAKRAFAASAKQGGSTILPKLAAGLGGAGRLAGRLAAPALAGAPAAFAQTMLSPSEAGTPYEGGMADAYNAEMKEATGQEPRAPQGLPVEETNWMYETGRLKPPMDIGEVTIEESGEMAQPNIGGVNLEEMMAQRAAGAGTPTAEDEEFKQLMAYILQSNQQPAPQMGGAEIGLNRIDDVSQLRAGAPASMPAAERGRGRRRNPMQDIEGRPLMPGR